MLKEKLMENKKKVIVVAVAAALLLSCGMAGAYFTDSNDVTNTFTVGGVTSELTETKYDAAGEAQRTLIAPGKAITKDPQVTNTDTLDMYTFLKVSVPVKNVATYDSATKAKTAATVQPLFTWEPADGWSLVKTVRNETSWDYYYAYATGGSMTTVAPGQTTASLFKNDKITFINVVEGQGIENTELQIPITDYSIQADNLEVTSPEDILEAILNQRR